MAEKIPTKAATLKIASEKEVVQGTIKYLTENPAEFETFQKNPEVVYGKLGLNINRALYEKLASYEKVDIGWNGIRPDPTHINHINRYLNSGGHFNYTPPFYCDMIPPGGFLVGDYKKFSERIRADLERNPESLKQFQTNPALFLSEYGIAYNVELEKQITASLKAKPIREAVLKK